nr:hypothetical protein [Tanacetum cinerariifolium]
KSQKKSDLPISSEESPSNKKSNKAKKGVAAEPKMTKKKEPRVPDEQHLKTSGADEGTGQQNVSQELGFEHVEKDAHVTLTPVLDTQKTDEPVQSSSVFFDFTSKLLNLENPSLADNEIASLMDTTVHHEEPRSRTSSLYTILVTETPDVTSIFTITIPSPPPLFNPFPQQASPTPTLTTSKTTTIFPALPDFASIFRFNN